MMLARILLALLCCAGVAVAQGHDGVTPAEAGQHAPQQHEPQATLEMENSAFFLEQYSHLVPHPIGAGHGEPQEVTATTFYNVNAAQLVAIVLMFVIFSAVLVSFRSRRPPWLLRVFRGFCMWIRDEMVVAVMGEEEGKKFAPYFLYLFFFIVFMNLLGLIPGGVTATATVFVTGTLAAITFLVMVIGGMMQQGVFTFWKNLLPHGLPFWLVPLMLFLEIVGLIVKPFALTIRLFANMLAGHLVIYSFIGMIFLFAKMLEMGGAAWATAIPVVGMGVFISIIEAFVAVLQAYIFTYLSIVFVQQSLHPAH